MDSVSEGACAFFEFLESVDNKSELIMKSQDNY